MILQVIEEHKGTVGEILGDGILAFWNTPDDVQNHEIMACRAALKQQEVIKQRRGREERRKGRERKFTNVLIGLFNANSRHSLGLTEILSIAVFPRWLYELGFTLGKYYQEISDPPTE